jgi:RNA polymerase sigma-70 factor (ECF subfamily)
VVQEVFIAAHQKRASFDTGNLSAWLYKITCNKSLNKLKRSKILKFEKLGENLQSTEGELGLSDKTLWALKQLKPKERALVYGRVMEEQSYAELSRMLGSSPETLRKQFERAKKKLAMILGGKGHNDG